MTPRNALPPPPDPELYQQPQQSNRQPPRHQRFLRPLPPLRIPSKRSYRSYSSSVEADDERSDSPEHDLPIMGPTHAVRRRGHPPYPGEDTRLTSQKELLGWYAYGFAAEVFVICGMGSFIPITLEQLARESGVLLPDRVYPCVPRHDASLNQFTMLHPRRPSNRESCVVQFWGTEVNTTSFAMYTFSISVAIQAIMVVSISCAADHGNYRKRLLLVFALVGSIATLLFLVNSPKPYLLAAFLAIISNACLGASFVLLNSFLPLLVRHHPTAQLALLETQPGYNESTSNAPEEGHEEISTGNVDERLSSATASLLRDAEAPGAPSESKQTSVELQLSTHISSRGIGIGYIAGLFVQCMGILLLAFMGSSTFSLRIVLFAIGLWWLVFTIPAALYLRPRPGPPLPSADPSDPTAKRSWAAYIAYSWASLWRTIKLARRLKDIVLFLIAWFLISDAIATVSGTAILFAKTELKMKAEAVGLISVIGTTSGILGAFGWSALSRWLGLKPHQTILACIVGFELIPIYCLLGFFPFVQRWGVIGLQQPWEMYLLGFVYGFVLGGISSYCRSLFGELIPPGSEAAFYALYAITDKGSSVFGPAIVGAIVDATGEIRPAFFFLAVLVGLPAVFIWYLDVDRGKAEGLKLAEVIEGYKDRADTETGRSSDAGDGEGAGEQEGLLSGRDEEER